MGKLKRDLTGVKHDYLECLGRAENNKNGKPMWFVKCKCGNIRIMQTTSFLESKSCGCYRREWSRQIHTKHGYTSHDAKKERLFNVWNAMKQRCENPSNEAYHNYGGRNIKVCDEWHDYKNFREWAYANGFDESLSTNDCTIDRIDVNGNYEPNNCRWVDRKVQARNTRTNRILEVNGEKMCIAEASERYGIIPSTIRNRIDKMGWSDAEAVTRKVVANGWYK